VPGKIVVSLEVDAEVAGLATGLMVEPCAVLAELRHMHGLIPLQPQEPSKALQLQISLDHHTACHHPATTVISYR